jgi:predicted metal-dependent phosphoesterase TrpH
MKIDLHVHTNYSYQGKIGNKPSDSIMSIEEIPQIANSKGLDGVVITDHMTHEAGRDIFERTKKDNPDFLLLRGMEYHSDHGHLLLYGITDDSVCKLFKKYGPIQKVINYVNSIGGIVIPSHPYQEGYSYKLCDYLFELKEIAALETVNAHLEPKLNEKAQKAARKLNLRGTGGSDAHHPLEIGGVYTSFNTPIHSERELLTALRFGSYFPAS